MIYAALAALLSASAASAMEVRMSLSEMHATPAVRPELVALVNANPASTWLAGVPQRFSNATAADVARLLGTVMVGESGFEDLPEREVAPAANGIPESFDSRTAWPACGDLIGYARDQSVCGSCWAFAATETVNDRICIATGDATMLSADDTLACCSGLKCGMSMGCNGGQPSGAWKFFQSQGVVSGGLYGDDASCLPYPFPPCAHHTTSTEYPPCGSTDYKTPACKASCSVAAYGTPYSKDKRFATSSYSVKGVSNIQTELMTNGPVTAAFTVYEDFETYVSGVYQHVSGSSLGGHAVKIIGWGVDNGTPYWTVVNSWNPSWGEDGLFRILRGSNECGIEGQIVTGLVV